MRVIPFLYVLLLALSGQALAQTPVEITNQTLRLGGNQEEILYFGFAAGDTLVFSFEEAKNKTLKEIEILQYPASSRFTDFKTAGIPRKTLAVPATGIYAFRLKNGAISGRICKVRISRIPGSPATQSFNTQVKWGTRNDTTWRTYTKNVIVGYDTTTVQLYERRLVSTDTVPVLFYNKALWVHSQTAIGKSAQTTETIQLPENTYSPNRFQPMHSRETIAWAYWLGVGQESVRDYQAANSRLNSIITLVGLASGYEALAQLALTGISAFAQSGKGDNVQYKIFTSPYSLMVAM